MNNLKDPLTKKYDLISVVAVIAALFGASWLLGISVWIVIKILS